MCVRRSISIVAMTVVSVIFVVKYVGASKKPSKTAAAKTEDFLPKDKKKN